MKNDKRILKVVVETAIDEFPETSDLGQYSDKPDGLFALDRATDEFQGDIETGSHWLERIELHLEDTATELEETEGDNPELAAVRKSLDTVHSLRTSEPFDDVSWNSREYRYFNGPVENYFGLPEEDIRKCVRQDYERIKSFHRGDWYYIGITAKAEIAIPTTPGNAIVQTITSGGLWGVESDSDKVYLESIKQEHVAELKDQLKGLGFSSRAISTAFKNVKEEERV